MDKKNVTQGEKYEGLSVWTGAFGGAFIGDAIGHIISDLAGWSKKSIGNFRGKALMNAGSLVALVLGLVGAIWGSGKAQRGRDQFERTQHQLHRQDARIETLEQNQAILDAKTSAVVQTLIAKGEGASTPEAVLESKQASPELGA